jgi:hypothetical protein
MEQVNEILVFFLLNSWKLIKIILKILMNLIYFSIMKSSDIFQNIHDIYLLLSSLDIADKKDQNISQKTSN